MALHEVTMRDGAVYQVNTADDADPSAVAAQVAAQHQASLPTGTNSGLPALALGAGKMVDNLASLATHIPGVNALDRFGQSMGLPSVDQGNAYSDELRANSSPMMRTAGEIGASLALPEGRAAGLGGLVARGAGNAATGALLSDKTTAGGVAGDAAASMLGGEAGRGVVKGLGALASPIVRPVVNALQSRGIRLTPGQILGGTAQKLEDGTQGSVLGLGDMIASARKRGLGDFVRATANDVLEPIGMSLPDHIPTGRESFNFVKSTLSNAYDSVLGAMHPKADPALQNEVGHVVQSAGTGPVDFSDQISKLWQTKVAPYFDDTGTMTGDNLKMIDRHLREIVSPYRTSSDGAQQAYAGHVDDLRTALKDSAARNSGPGAVAALAKVDNAYAKYVPMRDASAKTADGIFTPTGLGASVKKSDRSVGKGNTASGGANLQDISDAARMTLPSTVPDSGTARRLAIQSAFASGAGGAAFGLGAMAHAPVGLGLGALASLAYTKPGVAAMSGLLTGRQGPGFVAARGLLNRAAPYVGRATAAGVPALLARPQ